ncbi:Protein of unknown function, partial [Gryllus bimaculatus]
GAGAGSACGGGAVGLLALRLTRSHRTALLVLGLVLGAAAIAALVATVAYNATHIGSRLNWIQKYLKEHKNLSEANLETLEIHPVLPPLQPEPTRNERGATSPTSLGASVATALPASHSKGHKRRKGLLLLEDVLASTSAPATPRRRGGSPPSPPGILDVLSAHSRPPSLLKTMLNSLNEDDGVGNTSGEDPSSYSSSPLLPSTSSEPRLPSGAPPPLLDPLNQVDEQEPAPQPPPPPPARPPPAQWHARTRRRADATRLAAPNALDVHVMEGGGAPRGGEAACAEHEALNRLLGCLKETEHAL